MRRRTNGVDGRESLGFSATGAGSRASGEGWGEVVRGHDTERAVAAKGAAVRITTGEPVKERLPAFTTGLVGLGMRGRVEGLSGSFQETRSADIGLNAEVADPDESMGQNVEQESAYEVGGGEAELLAEIAVSAVAVAEGHAAVFESHQSFVADCDAMGVAAQVGEHLCWPSHGSLVVHDPPFGSGLAEQALP